MLDLPYAFQPQGKASSPSVFPDCNMKKLFLDSSQKINWNADPCTNWNGRYDYDASRRPERLIAWEMLKDVAKGEKPTSASRLDEYFSRWEALFRSPVQPKGHPKYDEKAFNLIQRSAQDLFYAYSQLQSAIDGDKVYAKISAPIPTDPTDLLAPSGFKTALIDNWGQLAKEPSILIDQNHVAPLDSLPHLLVAGTTGSGKSVFLETVILTLALSQSVSMILFDPKQVELSRFSGCGFLHPATADVFGTDVFTSVHEMPDALDHVENLMDARLRSYREKGVRNVKEHNALGGHQDEPIVCIIDEFADVSLQCGKRFSDPLGRIAAKARAAGIHLILATQKPTRDVMGPLVKANAPARVAFKVSCQTDSRIILDEKGAETLQNPGDGIFKSPNLGSFFFKGLLPSKHDSKNVAKAFQTSYKEEPANDKTIRKYLFRILVDLVWARKLLNDPSLA